jgi:hypothetical protein
MIGSHWARIVGLPLLAAVLAACPDPVAPEGESSTSTSSSSDSTAQAQSSSTSTSAGSTTVDPDGTTTTTGGSSEADSGTTGSGVDDPGCPECMVLAHGLEDGRGIAIDLDTVYFSDQARGTIERIDKGGGNGGVLASDHDTPYGVAVSSEHVYWTNFADDGAVMRVPIEGGEATLVADETRPRTVAVVGDQIYWGTFQADSGRVMRVPVALDEAPFAMAELLGGVADLVVDGDRVFFTAHTESTGVAFIEPPEDPPIGSVFGTTADPFDPEALTTSLAEPWGITVQGSTVLWINGMGTAVHEPRSVLSISAAGGIRSVLAPGQTNPWDVVADGEYVYWTDYTEVKALPLAGGEPIVLAEQQNNARSIVVDELWVFWITRDRVLQRPKP